MTYYLHDANQWSDRNQVVEFLADQLLKSRLGLLLGAGVSKFYGLPNWEELVEAMSLNAGVTDPATDLTARIDRLKSEYYRGDNSKFLDDLHDTLYYARSIDFKKISDDPTLRAIGSVAMASSRGNVAKIVTLNFDNLLELYLEFHGFVAKPIYKEKHWAGGADVEVFHPHGYLPFNRSVERSSSVVFGRSDFLSSIRSGTNLWETVLEAIMRTRTFVHIGLSGEDLHIQKLMHDFQSTHTFDRNELAYHSIILAKSGSISADTKSMYDGWGVYTLELKDHSEISEFLFSIAQRAREMRLGQIA